MKRRVYLDTCIFSEGALPSGRLVHNMNSLVSAAKVGNVEFVTSPTASEELEQIRDETMRALALVVVGLVPQVRAPFSEVVGGLGASPYGSAPFGGGSHPDPALHRLRQVFDAKDAEHVFQATRARCDVFLTDDRRTIINRVNRQPDTLAAICGPLRFLTIDELRADIEGAEG